MHLPSLADELDAIDAGVPPLPASDDAAESRVDADTPTVTEPAAAAETVATDVAETVATDVAETVATDVADESPETAPEPELTGFAALGLRRELLAVLDALEYAEPTPIQREAIQPLLAGSDLLGQAATGTGKTAAFALPVLEQLAAADPEDRKHPSTLVLAPTRELAVQVAQAFSRYGKPVGARVVAVYGGQSLRPQLAALARGVDIVVATPGRALDHINRNSLHTAALRTVVLDEADEMLDMGFADDLEAILAAAPDTRQTVLFSATMPSRINTIAKRHLRNPVRIRLAAEERPEGEAPQVREAAYVVAREHTVGALARVLDLEAPGAALIFCKTRDEVDTTAEELGARGHRVEALHGGLSQEQRDRAMGRLRNGAVKVLVATDVAARGLDVDHLTHVVNLGLPTAGEAYVHRIGRIGRAGREGVALSIVEPRAVRRLRDLQRVTGREVAIVAVPQPADLELARLTRLRDSLGEQAPTDAQRALVEEFVADGQDPIAIAAAALALADAGSTTTRDEDHIPAWNNRGTSGKPERGAKFDRKPAGGKPWENKPERGGKPFKPGGKPQRGAAGALTNIFIGMGTEHKLRPQDLVGAICGESSLSGDDIGAIRLSDRFSLVAIPDGKVDEVVHALRNTRIKGRKATVRREKF